MWGGKNLFSREKKDNGADVRPPPRDTIDPCREQREKKKAQLREPLSETEIIAALGDISGLWEFMFPGARQELVHLLIGEIRVFADKISLTLKVDGLNNLVPDIVEAIVNGAEPDGLSIAQIMKNIPEDWNEQRKSSGFPER